MTAKIKSIWDKTSGYKTKTGGVLLAVYELVKLIDPNILTGKADMIAQKSINLLIITGASDWLWRNRKEIWQFTTGLFKKKTP